MKELVSFDDYELISDLLVPLGKNASLRMCIRIGQKNRYNEKVPMESEYMYRTNKYVNKESVITVKRKFFPYMAIEYKDYENPNAEKETIKITHYDILGFQDKVFEVDRQISKTFRYDAKIENMSITHKFHIVSIPNGNTIEFSPVIITQPDKSMDVGILLTINDKIQIDIPIRTWKAFFYYVKTADFYGWAAAAVSGYTQGNIGRHVQDLSSISRNPTVYDEFNDEVGFKNSKPLNKEEQKKSFFDD